LDKLLKCAIAFSNLLDIKYHFKIGRKGKLKGFTLHFNPYHFHHLIGLQKLSDIQKLKGNRERIFKEILSGNITHEMIEKSNDYHSMGSRLSSFHKIEDFLDSNSLIFNYSRAFNLASRIEAIYLLQNGIDDKINYLFLDKESNSDYFYGKSFFPKENMDYSKSQPLWKLLYKKKIFGSGKDEIQFDKLTTL